MDMWDPYVASVRAHLPEADGKIVFGQVSCGPAFWVMLWTRYGGRKQNSESRRGRPFGGHPLRLAQESDIDGTEGPQGVRRTEKQ